MEAPGAGMQKSTIMVVPPDSAALVPHSKSSADTVPMNISSIWVCGSIPPGITKQPPASMISAPLGASSFGATAAIVSPSISTSARRLWSWLTTVPPRMSTLMMCSSLKIRTGPHAEAGSRTSMLELLSRVGHGMAEGAFRLLRDDRIGTALHQGVDGALIGRLVERSVGALGELVDLAHHADLMLLGLSASGVVFENDLGGCFRIFTCPGPAFHRGFDEARHDFDEFRIGEPLLKDVETVFESRDTLVLIFEDDEVLRLDASV